LLGLCRPAEQNKRRREHEVAVNMVAALQLKQDESAARKTDMERHLASVVQVPVMLKLL
jgi:hypothetical protein